MNDNPHYQRQQAEKNLSNWQPVFACWFPHSGGRWLNRGLIGRHKQVSLGEAFSPLLTVSLDELLALDTTYQVHKSRTQRNREGEFDAVYKSMMDAQFYGLQRYFSELQMRDSETQNRFYAALPVGSRIAVPHFEMMHRIMPKMILIHLVRNPISCFASLKSRMELGGDPCTAAVHWVRLNKATRHFWKEKDSNYLVARYEDLCESPQETADNILASMGLHWDEEMNKGIEEYHGRNQGLDIDKRVTNEERNIIKEICAGEAAFYDYEL